MRPATKTALRLSATCKVPARSSGQCLYARRSKDRPSPFFHRTHAAEGRFSTSTTKMASPRFSAGSDQTKVTTEMQGLMQAEHPWQLCANGKGVERAFKFKTFKAAWAFMDSVAASAKTERHHPEWSNTYNRVFVRWTTHNPVGLSEKDTRMAALCDELAKRPETLEIVDEEIGTILSLRHTADQAADEACACASVPKSSGRAGEREQVEAIEKEEGAQGSVAGIGGQPS